MKSDESLHITIKKPPLTVRSLGIFSNVPDTALLPIIQQFLTQDEPKNEEFLSNVREEVMQLLLSKTVLSVSISDSIYTVKLR